MIVGGYLHRVKKLIFVLNVLKGSVLHITITERAISSDLFEKHLFTTLLLIIACSFDIVANCSYTTIFYGTPSLR